MFVTDGLPPFGAGKYQVRLIRRDIRTDIRSGPIAKRQRLGMDVTTGYAHRAKKTPFRVVRVARSWT
jgi:hypothetical protein